MRIWSVARYDLKLSESEFWQLTPRQLDALLQSHKHKVEHDEFMFAQLTAYSINFSMAHPDKLVQPKDLMPSQWDCKPKTNKPRMTKKRRQNIADAFRAFGGIKVT